MKIDIVINCHSSNIQDAGDCKTRSEYFAYMLKNYLIKHDDINVNIHRCYPFVKITKMFKNITINNFEKPDHIIYIDDGGFYKTEQTFLTQLKNVTNNSVTSLGKHYKYYGNEDLMFIYTPNNNYPKTCYIKPPLDINKNLPKKKKDIIYILISKPESDIRDYNIENTIHVLNAIEILLNNNQYERIEFKIALINKKTINIIDINGNIIKTKEFKSYCEYLNELNSANMYFQLIPCDDIYKLYELAMANTLIITTNIYIPTSIISELNIYKYDTELNWTDIFFKMNSYNQRQILIKNDYLWENVVNTIIDKLKDFELVIKSENNLQSNLHSTKLGYYLDINNKSRSQNKMKTNITQTPITNKQTEKTIKNRKIPILLQSQL